MRVEFIVPFFLLDLALSGPARRDCGQEKCYDAVNECGMTYGGCWTECADGLTEIPTFTAPLCTSSLYTAVKVGVGYPTQASDVASDVPSSTDVGTAEPLITSPPALGSITTPAVGGTGTCSPLWLCIDYEATCGNLTQIYGGCYDVCTSSPPVTSPTCSLSSTTSASGYAANEPTPEPGDAYTEKPASDDIEPAIDDSKALVMAEMPNVDASASAPAPEASATISEPAALDADELRIDNVQADGSEVPAEATVSALIEAPASLRGQAIAKMMADKIRKPNTANVPCYDDPKCKEVQLGPPQSSSVDHAAEPTAEPSADTPTDIPTYASAESSAA